MERVDDLRPLITGTSRPQRVHTRMYAHFGTFSARGYTLVGTRWKVGKGINCVIQILL